MLGHTKPYNEKIHYIDVELAGRVRKLVVKLQSLCRSGFSQFAVRILAKPYHLSELTNNTLRKQRWGNLHFFTLKLECHNCYNNLLWGYSANGDIA